MLSSAQEEDEWARISKATFSYLFLKMRKHESDQNQKKERKRLAQDIPLFGMLYIYFWSVADNMGLNIGRLWLQIVLLQTPFVLILFVLRSHGLFN